MLKVSEPLVTRSEQLPSLSDVVDFLKSTPDFFVQHPELLDGLTIPHEVEGVSSLIEHQVVRLKDRNRAARQQIYDMIEIAGKNDILSEKIQQMTLELIDTRGELTELILTLQEGLHWHFEIDTTQLLILDPPSCCQALSLEGVGEISTNKAWVIDLERIFMTPEPICGRFKSEQTSQIFKFQVGNIGSVALVPLITNRRRVGLLALGSDDQEHFHPAMGTHFLRFLAGVLGLLLEPLIWS